MSPRHIQFPGYIGLRVTLFVPVLLPLSMSSR